MSFTAVAAVLLLAVLLLRPTDCRVIGNDTDQDQDVPVNYRLAGHLKPVHYSLTLAPFIYSSDPTEFHFTGSVRISVRVITSTNNFQLHSKQLFIASLQVLDFTGAKLTVRSIEEDIVRQWQHVTMYEPLTAGSNYTIVVDRFQGSLRRDSRGLYLNQYTENGVTKYMVESQLESTEARKAFPCFDEPALKATFDVSLVRRHNFMSISNMPSKAVTNISAADWFGSVTSPSEMMMKEDFKTTPIMSTYLLAFVVSQFECIRDTDNKGRRYRGCTRPDLISDAQIGLKSSTKFNVFFEDLLRVENPLMDINQAAVPSFNGGMENWGLIIYGEHLFTCNTAWTTSDYAEYSDVLIAHEIAHQWFGNLVTMTWWNEVWLNEGFASFFSYLGADKIYPIMQHEAMFVPDNLIVALAADSSAQSHPVERSAQTPGEIAHMFDTITYSKGGSVVRMMYYALGAGVFRAGLTNYLKINSYSNTFASALYQSLTAEANNSGIDLDIGEVMDGWIKQIGYPVVSSCRHNHQLMLSQRHFLDDPSQTPDSSHPGPFNYTWIIPITMVTKDNVSSLNGSEVSHLVHWMRDKSQTFSINGAPSWYLLNVRSTGFYRVNYDESNWNALISQLLTDHTVFTPHDRARMLDDSLALASAGYISYEINLRMLRYLWKETHLAPWKAAKIAVPKMLPSNSQQKRIHYRYLYTARKLFQSAYEFMTTTWPYHAVSGRMKRQLQGLIVRNACSLDVSTCRSDAAEMCNRFVASGFAAAVVPPDVRLTALCVGMMMDGGAAANGTSPWQKLVAARNAGKLHWVVEAEANLVERAIAANATVTGCISLSQ